MSAASTPMATAFAMARQPGPASPPVALLARADHGPVATDAREADDVLLFDELEPSFGFIRLSSIKAPSATQMADWAALLRWLTADLRAWSASTDPDYRRLRALLAVTVHLNEAGDPWAELVADLTGAADLEMGLARFIAGVRFDIQLPEGAAEWERQALLRFHGADAAQDWDAVRTLLPQVLETLRPPWMIMQASWALSALNPAMLVMATSGVETILTAIVVSTGLQLDRALALGAATGSDRLRFAVVSQHLEKRRGVLSPASAAQAVILLANVGSDPARWATWMRACFHSPGAYPALLVPLGAALAGLPDDRFEALLDVLPLEEVADSRPLATVVFDAFAGAAPPKSRKALWASAFARWKAWGFEGFTDGAARSTFDYAVVGHLVEGLTPGERRAAGRKLRVDRTIAESAWYGDRSELQQARYRFASARLVHIWARKVLSTEVVWLDPRLAELPRAYRSRYRDLWYNGH